MKIRYKPKAYAGKFLPGDRVMLDTTALENGTSIAFRAMSMEGTHDARYQAYMDFLFNNGIAPGGTYEIAGCCSYGKDPKLRNRFVVLKDDRPRGGVKYPDDIFIKIGDIRGTYTTTTTSTSTLSGTGTPPLQPGDPGYKMTSDPVFKASPWYVKVLAFMVWVVYNMFVNIGEGLKKMDAKLYRLEGNLARWIGMKPKRRFKYGKKGRN